MSRKNRVWETVSVMAAVLAVMGVTASFCGQWPWRANQYNSYTLQALSWLRGRLDVDDRAWLELAVYGGRYYVSFPPFPSVVLLPFAATFGENTPDGWIALAVTMIGVIYACRLYFALREDGRDLALWALFLFLGTGYLFIAMNGYVWFLAQNLCFTLSLIALDTARQGKGGRSLAALACAAGCRPMVLLFTPVIGWMLLRQRRQTHPEEKSAFLGLLKEKWYWAVAPLAIGGAYMALNAARFGSVTEFGHNYLPEFQRAEYGQFSLHYLKDNLRRLLRLPGYKNGALHYPETDGFAFFLADPFYPVAFAAWLTALVGGKRRLRPEAALRWDGAAPRILIPAGCLLYAAVLCLHRTMGGWQFGVRYFVDMLPWMYFGLLIFLPEEDAFRRWAIPAAALGAALNLIGITAAYAGWI